MSDIIASDTNAGGESYGRSQRGGKPRPAWTATAITSLHPALDVNALTRQGRLTPGTQCILGWGDTSESCWATVRLRAQERCIELMYGTPDGAGRRERLLLEFAPSRLGLRPLLVCPGCDRGFYRLFLREGTFRCRYCHRLRSQGGQGGAASSMEARVLPSLPEKPEFALIWTDGEMPSTWFALHAEPCCDGAARLQPGATRLLQDKMPHPAHLPDWGGGRPAKPLSAFPCTCEAGDLLEGHRSDCPKGRVIYRRGLKTVKVYNRTKRIQEPKS